MRRKCHIPAEALGDALLFLAIGEYSDMRKGALMAGVERNDLFVLTVGDVELRFTAAQVERVLNHRREGIHAPHFIPASLTR